MGGARDGARRVKAKKAAGGFDDGLAWGHAWRNVREIFLVLLGRKLGSRLAQHHELAVVSFGWKRDAILALGLGANVEGIAKTLLVNAMARWRTRLIVLGLRGNGEAV